MMVPDDTCLVVLKAAEKKKTSEIQHFSRNQDPITQQDEIATCPGCVLPLNR